MSVFYFLLLSCLGLATTAQAQDCGRPTGGPNLVPNSDISSSTFPDGSKVTFKCQPGYVTAGGNGRITCTNGTWSPLTLKCERRSCGDGGHVENGEIEYHNGILFGDKMVITCNTGYRLIGRKEIYCGAQGWDDVLPRCEAVTCEPPPPPVDASYNPMKDTYNYGEAIRYTCTKKDDVLNGSKTISCSENEKFEPNPPTCVKVNCDEPDVPNGEWVEGARPPYGYRASVTYECKSGYKMKGEPTITCGINSRWSPEPPTCKNGRTVTFKCQVGYNKAGGNGRITCTNGNWSPLTLKCERNCGNAGHVENGVIKYHNGTWLGDKMVITCNTGYRLVGRSEILCEDQGWGDKLPVCEEVICDEPDVPNGEWVGGARPPYRYQASVRYKCKSGYKMEGQDSFTCGMNSRWSPEPPTCIKIKTTTKATPTTTTTITTLKPTEDDLKGTGPDKNNGNTWKWGLGIACGVIFGIGSVALGIVGYRRHTEKKKKQGIRIDHSDAEKDVEGIALS